MVHTLRCIWTLCLLRDAGLRSFFRDKWRRQWGSDSFKDLLNVRPGRISSDVRIAYSEAGFGVLCRDLFLNKNASWRTLFDWVLFCNGLVNHGCLACFSALVKSPPAKSDMESLLISAGLTSDFFSQPTWHIFFSGRFPNQSWHGCEFEIWMRFILEESRLVFLAWLLSQASGMS